MLVKTDKGDYVNTDHVVRVFFLGNGDADIYTTGHAVNRRISATAATYLLEMMNAQSAVILPGEPGYVDPDAPSTQPLASRIAQLLRDELITGATIDQLMEIFHLDYYSIYTALDTLIAERTVVGPAQTDDTRYCHASHMPQAQTLVSPKIVDPLPFRQMIREGKLQCCKCTHQGCNDCADNNACCRCNCPSFTALGLKISPASDDPYAPFTWLPKTTEADKDEQAGREYLIKQIEQLLEFFKRNTNVTPIHDPLIATEASASRPEADSEKKADRTN